MKSKWFEKRWSNYVPLIMLAFFSSFYIFTQYALIECKSTLICQAINTTHVFSPETTPLMDDKGNLMPVLEDDKSLVARQKEMAERYNARFIWTFLIMGEVLFCVLAIFFFCIILKNSLNKPYYLISIVILAFLIGMISAWKDPMPLLDPMLTATIQKSPGGVSSILAIIKWVNGITYATSIMAVFTISAILLEKSDIKLSATEEGLEEDVQKNLIVDRKIEELFSKLLDLRTLLYINTILLVIGVLRMTALNNWGLEFVTTESITAAKIFFSSLASLLGGFFTLLLVATFLPAAYILQQRTRSLLKDSTYSTEEQTSKLNGAGFSFSASSYLLRLIAVTAPLLTGGIVDVLSKIPSPFPP